MRALALAAAAAVMLMAWSLCRAAAGFEDPHGWEL